VAVAVEVGGIRVGVAFVVAFMAAFAGVAVLLMLASSEIATDFAVRAETILMTLLCAVEEAAVVVSGLTAEAKSVNIANPVVHARMSSSPYPSGLPVPPEPAAGWWRYEDGSAGRASPDGSPANLLYKSRGIASPPHGGFALFSRGVTVQALWAGRRKTRG
jgi:hypothetical protein